MRPESLAKIPRGVHGPLPMRANAIKNTTPRMPARVWGPRGAPGAPQAFRSVSQVSPRRGTGAAQAQPRRCSCCQASPGAPGTRERRKTKARGRRCQALPGASRGHPALPAALGSSQALPNRSKASRGAPLALPCASQASPRQSAVERYSLVASTPCGTAAASQWSVA